MARHLAECPRCRDAIAFRRAVRRAAREPAQVVGPALPDTTRAAVLTRLARGERLLLPTTPLAAPEASAEPHHATPVRGAGRVAARANLAGPHPRWKLVASLLVAGLLLVASVAGVLTLIRPAPLVAGATTGMLSLTPTQPRPGDTITVVYRPAALLSGEPQLHLRARFRRANDQEGDFSPVPVQVPTVATLTRRDDGQYAGRFRLPDSVVYVALAVESPGGRVVDANGRRQWELLVHDGQRRPTLAARDQQVRDLFGRDWERSYGLLRRVAADYPDAPGPAYLLYHYELELPGATPRAEITARHRARFARIEARLLAAGATSATDELRMMVYARRLGNGREAFWRERLFGAHARSAEAAHWRTWHVIWRFERDTVGLFRALDALWEEVGPADRDPANMTLGLAMERGDREQILRWAARADSAAPAQRADTWAWLATKAEDRVVRDTAMQRLRALLAEGPAPDARPLGVTAAAFGMEADRRRAMILTALGRALLRAGALPAGLDTLARATATAWDPAVFRDIAAARLAVGDSAGALEAAALVARDPLTAPTYADSARRRLGRWGGDSSWHAATAAADMHLARLAPRGAISRPLPAALALTDARGRAVPLMGADSGTTIVLYWSPACPPAIAALRAANGWAPALARYGVRVVAVTADAPSPETSAALARWGVTVPMLYDGRGTARSALEAWATPTFFVLRGTRVIAEHAGLREAENVVPLTAIGG